MNRSRPVSKETGFYFEKIFKNFLETLLTMIYESDIVGLSEKGSGENGDSTCGSWSKEFQHHG